MAFLKRYTVRRLADRLGVSPAAIRYWIRQGWIVEPAYDTSVSAVVFSLDNVLVIEDWYRLRVAAGLPRGSRREEKSEHVKKLEYERGLVSTRGAHQDAEDL